MGNCWLRDGKVIFTYLNSLFIVNSMSFDRHDGVEVRASASQSVDLRFIPLSSRPGVYPLVDIYQKTLKNGIYSFPAWRSTFKEGWGE